MISIETFKHRSAQMVGEEFPLVFWHGNGRIVASDDTGLDLLVRGIRTHLTWERLADTWKRLRANKTLSVDELGGGQDATGIVSLFAFVQGDGLDVHPADGLLVLCDHDHTPVHQYAAATQPASWAPWRRKIHGH